MAEKNNQIASLDSGRRLPKLKSSALEAAKDAAEDAALLKSRKVLVEENPEEVKSRGQDEVEARAIMAEMPFDVSEVTIVDPLKGNDDRRIVKLKDGTLAIHHFSGNKLYVEKGRKLSGVLDVYNFETGEKTETVFGSGLGEKSALAYARLKEMNDKLDPPAPDVLDVQNVETLRALGGDRSVVKFPDGTLGVENSMRQSFLLVFKGEVYEFDSRTGKKTDKKLAISELKGKTKEAFDLIAKLH